MTESFLEMKQVTGLLRMGYGIMDSNNLFKNRFVQE